MKKNIQLSSQIKQSIFETNSFLLQNEPTIIEYDAFFGSKKIFNNIHSNGIELTPSLWLYAIHGNNSEIIHLLEENHIEPTNKSYEICLKEAVKCHHNDIVNHFIKHNFDHHLIKYSFQYYNYLYFPNDIENKTFFNIYI